MAPSTGTGRTLEAGIQRLRTAVPATASVMVGLARTFRVADSGAKLIPTSTAYVDWRSDREAPAMATAAEPASQPLSLFLCGPSLSITHPITLVILSFVTLMPWKVLRNSHRDNCPSAGHHHHTTIV